MPRDGNLNQSRGFACCADWQVLEEHVDDDFVSNPGLDAIAQQFWGIRGLDDAVMRRTITGVGTPEPCFYITDRQGSTVAMLGFGARLLERISYSAYGVATHRFPGDWTLDGVVGADDVAMAEGLGFGSHEVLIDEEEYIADFDLNRDGRIDDDDIYVIQYSWWGFGPLAPGAISDPAGPGNPIGYTGHVFNPESRLYTARHRHYDPDAGRWLTEDPAGEVDGPNLYQYVLSNPFSFMDPFGLQARGSPYGESMRQALAEARARGIDPRQHLRPGMTPEQVRQATRRMSGVRTHAALDDCEALLRRKGDPYHNWGNAQDQERLNKAVQEGNAKLAPAGNLLLAAGEAGASMVPGVGEYMDWQVMTDSNARWWHRGLAGGSLGVNILTAGLVPNVGPLIRSGERFSESKQALVDMAKRDKRTGMTEADMRAYQQLNKELPDPFPIRKVRGPERSTRPGAAPSSRHLHGHVGPIDHIPIRDMP